MNDDQLSNELRRRAGAVDVPDLLPSVRSAMDPAAGTAPVARWAAFAGVAGSVAVLLLLVFALPRISGPAATSPTPLGVIAQPPTTISTLSTPDFARLLAAGSLRGHTVGVIGDIEPITDLRSDLYRSRCEAQAIHQLSQPDETCVVGRLVGADPAIWVHSEFFARGLRLQSDPPMITWRGTEAPRNRHFVLSVDAEDLVTILGSADDDWTLVVRELAALKATPAGFGTAYVVPGWLTGSVVPTFCPPMPSPDVLVEPLPGRRCGPESWLTERATTNPAALMPGESVRVQDGAYTSFAPAPSDQDPVEPRAGLYVVAPRLEGDGCPDAAACWQWEVVGRVTLNDENPVAQPIATRAPENNVVVSPPASPEPVPTSSLECSGNRVTPEDAWVSVVDHADAVVSCAVTDGTGAVEPSVSVTGNPAVVAIEWPTACHNDLMDTRIDLWHRESLDELGNVASTRPPYLLVLDRVERFEPDTPWPCLEAPTGRKVELLFDRAITSADLETVFTADGAGADAAQTSDGAQRFMLKITAADKDVAGGQAVGVSSQLTSAFNVTISCPSGPIISLEQLNGDIRFSPGPFLAVCGPSVDLTSGKPITREFLPAVSGPAPPHPLEKYIQDGKLFLPPGTYRFVARSSFGVGDRPDSEWVELEASVVVTVR